MSTSMDWFVRSLAAITLLVLIAHPGVGEAKVRCNIRSCAVIGGMEVTLRAFDKIREGSKLNILKTRKKVGKAGARVTLRNHYLKGDELVWPPDEITVTGRDAKKVKLVGWDGFPIGEPFLGFRGSFGCDGGGSAMCGPRVA